MGRFLGSFAVFLLLFQSTESNVIGSRKDARASAVREPFAQRLRDGQRRLKDIAKPTDPTAKIVGGEKADPTRYPYFVLYDAEYEGVDGFSSCAGVLIHEDILLSVASCGVDLIYAYAFVNYTQDFHSVGLSGNEFESLIDDWETHPNYDKTTSNNDIMVMRLQKPVSSGYVSVPYNVDPAKPVNDEPVRVLGMGVLRYDTNFFPQFLREGDVNVVDFENCNDENSYNGRVNDTTMICAGRTEGGVVCFSFVRALCGP